MIVNNERVTVIKVICQMMVDNNVTFDDLRPQMKSLKDSKLADLQSKRDDIQSKIDILQSADIADVKVGT